MLTLAEHAKLVQNPVERGLVETIVLESAILDFLPMQNIAGNSFRYNLEATLPGVEFRAVNSAYAESTGTVNQKTESLTILGGDSDVDKALLAWGGNEVQERSIALRGKAKAMVIKFQDTFFNGDVAVDANSFDGLKKRLVNAQVIDAAANGMPVTGADDNARQSFLDQLDLLISRVPGCQALYMNSVIRGRVLSTLRRLNLVEKVNGGALDKINPAYRGIALLDAGQRADGTEILPQTETQGTSTVASSIYAVKYGRSKEDQGVTGLQTAPPSVVDLGELDSKPALRHRVEYYPGLAVFGGRGAARLRGVLAA